MANTLSYGQSTASYLSGTSPSFQQSLTSEITATAVPGITDVANLGVDIDTEFGIDDLGQFSATGEALTGLGALNSSQDPAWTFITAPEDISWSVVNNSSRVDIFGTNNTPVVAGSRGMVDLDLSNALVEGFVRNINVEGKIVALEKLMEYKLNASDGFVSVPVYWVTANEKKYGGYNGGYFIIKDVQVKETMRDLSGNTTRAYVDVSFTQVPYYQVNTGRDQASVVTAGGLVRTNPVAPGGNSQANNASSGSGGVAGSATNGGSTSTNARPASGPAAPAATTVPTVDPTVRRSFRPAPGG